MKALSLIQPWASLIAIGAKKIETRSRLRPPASLIGQRIAIHASKGFPRDAKDACLDPVFVTALWSDITRYATIDTAPDGGYMRLGSEFVSITEIEQHIKQLPCGVIIATARVTGCWSTNRLDLLAKLPDAERAFGNYAPDRWMWGLADVQVLPEPIAASGKLGLWEWQHPDEVEPVNTEGCIYVDQIIHWGNAPAPGAERFFGNGKPSCHMSTSDHSPAGLEALHRFAGKLGMKRAWFQDTDVMPHYDLTPSKRSLAVRNGAIAVEGTEIVRICGRERIKKLLTEGVA